MNGLLTASTILGVDLRKQLREAVKKQQNYGTSESTEVKENK